MKRRMERLSRMYLIYHMKYAILPNRSANFPHTRALSPFTQALVCPLILFSTLVRHFVAARS